MTTIATGSIVFGTECDTLKLEDIQMQDFGKIGEVVITKNDTMMLNGGGDAAQIARRVD